MGPAPYDVDRWQRLLSAVQAQPAAWLNAVDESGLFVPLPAPLRALGRPALLARSGIESVEAQDHGLAIAAWVQVLEQGESQMEVRDRRHPDVLTRVQFFDVRATCGVLVALAWPTTTRRPGSGHELPRTGDGPRLGRLTRDQHAVIISADRDVEHLLGHPPGALIGLSGRDLVHPDDQQLAVSAWIEMLGNPGGDHRVRLRQLRGDGSWLWVDVVNHNHLADPVQGCVLTDVIDVSQEMALGEDVRSRERLLRRLTQALPTGIAQLSVAREVVYANEQLHRLLRSPAAGSFAEQCAALRPQDRSRLVAGVDEALLQGRDVDLQVELAGGTWGMLEVQLRPLLDSAGQVESCLACFTDITVSMQLRAELERQASQDPLTGCLNRRAVLQRLAVDGAQVGPGRGCAVLFLDLDDFKRVNDEQGHAAGDDVLCGVADVLRAVVRSHDAVGRLGGDEFVLVCPDVGSDHEAQQLALDVHRRLQEGRPERVGVSIGVTWFDDPGLPADAVLARADEAMYAAKTDDRVAVRSWTSVPGPRSST